VISARYHRNFQLLSDAHSAFACRAATARMHANNSTSHAFYASQHRKPATNLLQYSQSHPPPPHPILHSRVLSLISMHCCVTGPRRSHTSSPAWQRPSCSSAPLRMCPCRSLVVAAVQLEFLHTSMHNMCQLSTKTWHSQRIFVPQALRGTP
jgi:hypothetical protein